MGDSRQGATDPAAPLSAAPVASMSLGEYGACLRDGRFTAQATTARLLSLIEQENPKLGAYTSVAADVALAAAQGIDAMLRGGTDLGPLMGVPIALKDLYAATGMPMTAGSRIDIADRVPSEGTLVRALKRAGTIVLGKTRTTEFAFGAFNPTHPTPWNPRDPQVHRMPGGSSAGSAVAQAAGLCALAFGTDTGGSVRQPAALCGVAGFKCTAGRLPMDGVFPLSPTFDSPGWFANRVDDLAVVWELLSGEPPGPQRRIESLVFGRPDRFFFDDLDPAVAAAVDDALRRLAAAGARIVPVTLPSLDDLDTAFGAYLSAELVAYLGRDRVTRNLSLMDPVVAARIAPGLTLSAEAFLELKQRFAARAREARHAVIGIDALIAPTCARVAAPVESCAATDAAAAWSRQSLRLTRPINLFGFCGLSLPVGDRATTLPVGLQLVARGGADSDLLAIGAAVEAALGAPNA